MNENHPRDFTQDELKQAHCALLSTLSKCEKAFKKLKEGTPQHTLTDRRIKALKLSRPSSRENWTSPEGS